MSRQQMFIDHIREAFADDPRVRALFLTGSFGRGTADGFSDVDLLLVADPSDHAPLVSAWKESAAAFEPIVHSYQPPFQPVHCLITEGWLRADLAVPPADPLRGLTQDRSRPLIDRDGLYASLPERLEARPIDGRRLDGMVREFIRVLGLTPVVAGRDEVELAAVSGAGLLRRFLTDLLILEVNLPDSGGILHLSRVLDPERLAVLAAIPQAELSLASAQETQLALAQAYFPRARRLYSQLGLQWPHAFEAATLAQLRARLPQTQWGWD